MTQALHTHIIESLGEHRYSIFLLHGLGADAMQFDELVRELNLPESLGVRFVFPQAPDIAVTINQGYKMPAWYDILHWDKLSGEEDREGLLVSQKQLEQLLLNEPVAIGNIILGGFSQGGAISLHTGLRGSLPLKGILALSAYLPLMQEPKPEPWRADKNLPVFMAHGSQDEVVPLSLAEMSKDCLEQVGYSVDWQSYPMAHSMCLPEVQAMRHWLLELLK